MKKYILFLFFLFNFVIGYNVEQGIYLKTSIEAMAMGGDEHYYPNDEGQGSIFPDPEFDPIPETIPDPEPEKPMPDLGEGAGGSILDLLEDSDYPTPEGFYDNNNTGNDNNTGDDDSSTVLDPPSPPTTGDPEETCDDPCACWGECGDDNDDNDDYGDETPIPKEKDCAGVEDGKAYFDDCEECVGGTTEKQPCKESPCEKVNRLLQNEQINKQYKQLLEKAKNKATKEWGTEIVAHFNDINNWLNVTGAYSIKSPEIREGNDHSFELNWKDDSKAFNRMLGYMHTHPTAGTCFSPGDINKFISLKDSPTTLERMSKDAMCVAITPEVTYILTIKDWNKIKQINEKTLKSLEKLIMGKYKNLDDNRQESAFINVYLEDESIKGTFNLIIKKHTEKDFKHLYINNNSSEFKPCN